MDGKGDEVGCDSHEGHDYAWEIDFAEDGGVGYEGVGCRIEACGEVAPKGDAKEVEKWCGRAVGGDVGYAAEDNHIDDDGEYGGNQEPEGAKECLFVHRGYVAADEEEVQVAVAVDFPEVYREEFVFWLYDYVEVVVSDCVHDGRLCC